MNVCVGDDIVVQGEKEAIKTKEPVVTSKWIINGRYAVFVYGETFLHFSSKIKDGAWKKSIKEKIELLHLSGGILIRTNAQYVSEEILFQELNKLHDVFFAIKEKANYRTVYTCLYRPEKDYLTAIRDTYSNDLSEIITDVTEIFQELQQNFAENFHSDLQKI